MDRDAALAEAERLNDEHPERDRFRWAVAGSEERGWSVARIPLRPGQSIDPLKTSIEAAPKPNPADDPRPSNFRAVPPYGGA
jgi:hypothetical protein